jgi:RNA polymerase sigma-70 factor (ECF subfamily)
MFPAEAALLEHVPDLKAWCLDRCGDPHLADDVTQETVLVALRRLPELREPERLRGWMFRIAQRRLSDAARGRGWPLLPLTREPVAPDPWPTARCERAERLHRALRKLPPFLSRPVRLHYLQGRPLRDIALSLHTTVNGVKARLYRARCILRKENL